MNTTGDGDAPFWTATQAITFLALGKAFTLHDLDQERERLVRWWRPSPWLDRLPLAPLLAARGAGGPDGAQLLHYPIAAEWKALMGPSIARSIRRTVRREQKSLISFPDLFALMQGEWDKFTANSAAIAAMTTNLVADVARGAVTMFGVQDGMGGSGGETKPVPATTFIQQVTINRDRLEPADGEPSRFDLAYEARKRCTLYHSLSFRPSDIRALLVTQESVESKPVVSRKTTFIVSKAKLDAVLKEYCEVTANTTGKPPAAETAERLLVERTNCTRPAAREAVTRGVEAGLLRKLGRPRKSPPKNPH